jgi:hemerythrin superfamily protein
MNAIIKSLSSSATDMIRADHTRVLALFHRYDLRANARMKQGLVNSICLALEIHAQIEEEIFYPAMRGMDASVVEKSIPEHDEMRRLIATLRSQDPSSAQYDQTFLQLMRNVIHHVADEETTLLPDAERLLAERLPEIGAQMTKRRLQLSAPRAGEMVANTARAMPRNTALVAAGALLAGAFVFRRALTRRHAWGAAGTMPRLYEKNRTGAAAGRAAYR